MRKIVMYMPDALIDKLDRIAKQKEMTRSMLIRTIIESGLKE